MIFFLLKFSYILRPYIHTYNIRVIPPYKCYHLFKLSDGFHFRDTNYKNTGILTGLIRLTRFNFVILYCKVDHTFHICLMQRRIFYTNCTL